MSSPLKRSLVVALGAVFVPVLFAACEQGPTKTAETPTAEAPPGACSPWPSCKDDDDGGDGGGGGDGRLAWENKVDSYTATDLAVAEGNGIVYVADTRDWIKAYRISDGKEIWKKKVKSVPAHPMVLSSDESTLFYEDKDVLYAVDASTGDTRWSVALPSGVLGAALSPDGSTLYLGGNFDSGEVLAVDLDARTVQSLGNPYSKAAAVIGVTATDGWVYFTGPADRSAAGESDRYDGYAAGINLTDDSQSWGHLVTTDHVAGVAPSYDGDRLYFPANDGQLRALDPSTGDEQWSVLIDDPTTSGGAQVSLEAVIGPSGNIIVSSYDDCGDVASGSGCVFSLGPSDGNLNWAADVGGVWNSSALVSDDGTVYVGARSGVFYALSASDGSTLWTYQSKDQIGTPITSDSDATSGNHVFFINDAGQVLALKGDTGSGDDLTDTSVTVAGTPWPKGSHDLRNTSSQ